MNRLQTEPSAKSNLLSLAGLGEAGVMSASDGQEISLFGPLHYEANYRYPLLVWLHGSGDSERQLRRVMPMISLRNYAAVAPRGIAASVQADAALDQAEEALGWPQTTESVAEAEQRIWSAISAARIKYNVRLDRIFLAGYESGGTMALRIASEHADRFAGVISLGGPYPDHGSPLANLTSIRRLPMFIAANREGTYYPTDRVCDNLRLLHTAGVSLTLREYPGGDGLSPQMLADVDRWMMEQIAQSAAVVGHRDNQQSGVN